MSSAVVVLCADTKREMVVVICVTTAGRNSPQPCASCGTGMLWGTTGGSECVVTGEHIGLSQGSSGNHLQTQPWMWGWGCSSLSRSWRPGDWISLKSCQDFTKWRCGDWKDEGIHFSCILLLFLLKSFFGQPSQRLLVLIKWPLLFIPVWRISLFCS